MAAPALHVMNDEPSDRSIDPYLDEVSAWQSAGIKKALKSADKGEFVSDKEIEAIFAKYIND